MGRGIINSTLGRAAREPSSVWISKALGKVQRLACKVITGALHTTATDVLDFHANLLSIHIRLNRSVFHAATRHDTLSPSHPSTAFSSVASTLPDSIAPPSTTLLPPFPFSGAR
jgi:hypothetical protein